MLVWHHFRLASGIATWLLVAWLSGYNTYLVQAALRPDHYSQRESTDAFVGVISSGYLDKEKYYRFDINIEQISEKGAFLPATGVAHLYLKKPTDKLPVFGDKLYVKSALLPIPPPMNPHEFDYRQYMQRKGIWSQSFVSSEQILVLDSMQTFSLKGWCLDVRERLRNQLVRYFPERRERQIAMALIVGIKDYLDPDMKVSYSTAGATHVLAVSGLHVGILFLFLSILLRPLKKNKVGRVTASLTSITVIWLYAGVTGLSPSVSRAAMMFSIVVFGELLGRQRSIYNSLGVAAFVLLLINPNYVFQVGFQLSFLAVLGIVYLFPKIYNLLYVPNALLEKVWSVTCVSIAAQISTAPLSLYYFNQFPTYFLFSNLAVIPSAFLILISGIPMLVAGFIFPTLGQLIADVLGQFIGLLNYVIALIEQLPFSRLDWLFMQWWEILILYAVFLALFWARQYRTFSNFAFAMLCLLAMLVSIGWRKVRTMDRCELTIYEVKGFLAIDLFENGKSRLLLDKLPKDLDLLRFQIDPHRLRSGYGSISEDWALLSLNTTCTNFYCLGEWRGKRLLNIRNMENMKFFRPVTADIVIISNNAFRPEMLRSINFEYLIFDGTNSSRFLRNTRAQLMQSEVEAHFVPFDGYWSITLK